MEKLIEENPNIHIHQYESNDYNFIKKSFQIFINKKTASDFLDQILNTYCDSSEKIFDDMYLTKNDCKRRYNEDMDEARGEKFIGPIARSIYYYESGEVMEIVFWNKGQYEGPFEKYNLKGELVERIVYKNGNKIDKTIFIPGGIGIYF